jgi:hypothetical protein
MVAFANGLGGNGLCVGGFGGYLGHGRNLRFFAANDSVEKADWHRFLVVGLDPAMTRKRLAAAPLLALPPSFFGDKEMPNSLLPFAAKCFKRRSR